MSVCNVAVLLACTIFIWCTLQTQNSWCGKEFLHRFSCLNNKVGPFAHTVWLSSFKLPSVLLWETLWLPIQAILSTLLTEMRLRALLPPCFCALSLKSVNYRSLPSIIQEIVKYFRQDWLGRPLTGQLTNHFDLNISFLLGNHTKSG